MSSQTTVLTSLRIYLPPPPSLNQTQVPQNPSNVASQIDQIPPAADEPVPTVKRCSCERRGQICPVDGACERSNVVYSSLVSSRKGDIDDTFCNSNRLDDRSLTSKTTGWGAVMTGLDRSHTSKMTGWEAVGDRLGGGW